VANAKPDGYTLGFFPPAASIPEVFSYFYQAPYGSKDLKPVSRIATAIGAIVVNGDSPMNSFKDLIEQARKNHGLKWGVNTKTSPSYIIMKSIAKAENLQLTEVPFDGDVKIVPAILGGHILVGSPTFASVRSLYAAKRVKLLAILIEKRADFIPDVPTIIELGFKLPPGMELAVFAPKQTPDDIVRKLNLAAATVSRDPAFRAKLMDLGIMPIYEDSKALETSIERWKRDLQVFFKEEGLVK
jgi:tripartite-type tricarboxylate transporter receptor subunit TctC